MKASVCIEMGWTEEEFEGQRWRFISGILEVFKERERAQEREIERARQRMQ